MKASDLFVILLYSIALFATFKVFLLWLRGGLNVTGAYEWFLRGFFMAWGVMTCVFVVLLIVRLIAEWK